jgi:hypothetical protein
MSENRSEPMNDMDRRTIVRGILGGAAVAALGLTLMPKAVEALPLAMNKNAFAPAIGLGRTDSLIEKAQVVVRRPRRRRWVCWWRRGRRVCGWRWV